MVDRYLVFGKICGFFYTWALLLYGWKGSKTQAGLQKHFHFIIDYTRHL